MAFTQPVTAVQELIVGDRSIFTGSGFSNARVAWWIEHIYDRGDITGRSLGFHGSGHCGDRQHIESRIEKCHAEGDSIINPGIAIDNDFFTHGMILGFLALLNETDLLPCLTPPW